MTEPGRVAASAGKSGDTGRPERTGNLGNTVTTTDDTARNETVEPHTDSMEAIREDAARVHGGPGARGARPLAPAAPDAYSDPTVSTSGTVGTPPRSSAVPPAVVSRESRVPPQRRTRGPRQARLSLRKIDPWSMLKFSFVLAIALFVVWMVAIGVLYGVLNGTGVFNKVNSIVNQLYGSKGRTITPTIVLGTAAVIGAINVVLFTAIATVGSFIYNLCSDTVGGVEVTFSERDSG